MFVHRVFSQWNRRICRFDGRSITGGLTSLKDVIKVNSYKWPISESYK